MCRQFVMGGSTEDTAAIIAGRTVYWDGVMAELSLRIRWSCSSSGYCTVPSRVKYCRNENCKLRTGPAMVPKEVSHIEFAEQDSAAVSTRI
jgi:hypothetical protein